MKFILADPVPDNSRLRTIEGKRRRAKRFVRNLKRHRIEADMANRESQEGRSGGGYADVSA
jgi:hypothetical protein